MVIEETVVCVPRAVPANFDANGAPCEEEHGLVCMVVIKRKVQLAEPVTFIMLQSVLKALNVPHTVETCEP